MRFAVPRALLQSLVYTGRTLSPADGLDTRLLDEVVAPADLLSRALAVARELARVPAPAFRLTKQALRPRRWSG
jgi:enoyl-CoA hydratase